jgi:methionyl-tRNA formyltransferase
MRIIFVAYREWALKVYLYIQNHPKVKESVICTSFDELYKLDVSNYDLLITLGLSNKIENNIYDKIQTIGLHCAELDRYSYGTPLQLQIIDGILKTKHRIFKLTSGGENSRRSHAHTREFANEIDLYLHGGMDEIFQQLTYTSIPLINDFIDNYPNTEWKQWPEEDIVREPRKAEDSKISFEEFFKTSTSNLYNLIRSLEDPYPNLFIEDEEGILYFKKVAFKSKY